MPNKYIVAIGFSAGGLIPLKDFFTATPHDDVTYILLNHFPPESKSELQNILQKYCQLVIKEAVNETLIEKDTIYMLPSSMYMTIEGDRLCLHPRLKVGLYPNRAVDIFLKSLATAKGSRSIAVILSGAGNDGTEGVQYIKKVRGLVLAQDIASSEFESMPRHAIESGNVDNEVLPSKMPKVITRHINERTVKQNIK